LEEIENKIKEKLTYLELNLSFEQKQHFHLRSINNFVYHIFNRNAKAYKSKSRLVQINIERNKKLLLEYLDTVITEHKITGNNNEMYNSKALYKIYVSGIGEFMNKNFGFSFSGGNFKYLTLLIWATLGGIIDLILWITTKYVAYYFTIGFICLAISRHELKKAQKKLYGPNY
jgi:predicted transport protein